MREMSNYRVIMYDEGRGGLTVAKTYSLQDARLVSGKPCGVRSADAISQYGLRATWGRLTAKRRSLQDCSVREATEVPEGNECTFQTWLPAEYMALAAASVRMNTYKCLPAVLRRVRYRRRD